MIHTHEDISYYESLEDVKEDGLEPIPITTTLSLFKLKGKTSIISLENLEPYCGDYLLYSPQEKRYYLKTFHGSHYKTFMDAVYSGRDEAINSLVNRISDGNVYLVFTKDMVTEMKAMLYRVYKGHLSGEGTLSYRLYLKLLEETLRYEEYKDSQKNITGYKTVCSLMEADINELWKQAFEKKK
jgi:hypothetical protein